MTRRFIEHIREDSCQQIVADGCLLFVVDVVVGVVQADLPGGREVALDPVKPRSVRRCEVKPDSMGLGVRQHLRLAVVSDVVEDDVQRPTMPVPSSEPFQELQERLPVLHPCEPSVERARFQVVDVEKVLDTEPPSVRVYVPGTRSTWLTRA